MTQGRARTAGAELHFELTGPDGAPLVALLHGGGDQLLFWDGSFVGRLVDAGFRVLRYDHRDGGLSSAHGGPDQVDGGYDLRDLADDVAALLDAVDVDAAHLVGHSMGGMVAQLAALRHPARVRSLGLVGTSTPRADDTFVRGVGAASGVVVQTREEVVAGALEYSAPTRRSRHPIPEELAVAQALASYERAYRPDGAARQWTAYLRTPDVRDQLRSIAMPTLVFHGRHDTVLSRQGAVALAERIPGAELQVHPGMGHAVPPTLWEVLADGVLRTVRAAESSR